MESVDAKRAKGKLFRTGDLKTGARQAARSDRCRPLCYVSMANWVLKVCNIPLEHCERWADEVGVGVEVELVRRRI
jgi:hypothetical protein